MSTESRNSQLTKWGIVAVSACLSFLVWGWMFTYTVYSQSLIGEFGMTRLTASTIYSTGLLSFFVFGSAAGMLGTHLKIRSILFLAASIVVVSIGAFQTISTASLLVIIFAFIGSAFGAVFVIILSVVPLWFDDREGLAMGLTLAGSGMGLLTMPFVWSFLIDSYNIRIAFLIVGSILIGVLLLAGTFFRRPRFDELSSNNASGEVISSSISTTWLGTILKNRQFWLSFAGLGMILSWYFVLSDQMIDMLQASHISTDLATGAFGLIGGVGVLSRIMNGVIADRLTPRITIVGGVVFVVLGHLALIFRSDPLIVLVSVTFLGIGYGGITALYAPVLIAKFGSKKSTAVIGLFMLALGTFAFLMPIVVSYLLISGFNYNGVLIILIIMSSLGIIIFWKGTAPHVAKQT